MCTTRVTGVVVGAVFTVVASRHKWLPMLGTLVFFCVLCSVKKVRVFHRSCFFLVSNYFNGFVKNTKLCLKKKVVVAFKTWKHGRAEQHGFNQVH